MKKLSTPSILFLSLLTIFLSSTVLADKKNEPKEDKAFTSTKELVNELNSSRDDGGNQDPSVAKPTLDGSPPPPVFVVFQP